MRLIGNARLGRDAEIRYTPDGTAVCNLSLAYNFGKKGDDGNRPTQWIDASLWGPRAESLNEYLLKGTVVHVVVRDVHLEFYEGRDGRATKLVGVIDSLDFTPAQRPRDGEGAPAQGSREPRPQGGARAPAGSTGSRARDYATASTGGQPKAGSFDDSDDDIPF